MKTQKQLVIMVSIGNLSAASCRADATDAATPSTTPFYRTEELSID